MQLNMLGHCKTIAIDYSFLCEYAGSRLFMEFIEFAADNDCDVYVGKDFVLKHYCFIHQVDEKSTIVNNAMRELVSSLINNKKFHELQALSSSEFIRELNKIDDVFFLTTNNSAIFKRIIEQNLSSDKKLLLAEQGEILLYESINSYIKEIGDILPSPIAKRTEFLDSKAFCSVGDKVSTGKQEIVTLGDRISNGAEGMVFKTDNPRIVAKIFHRGVITPLRWSKLTKMVQLNIKTAEICWPQDLLFYRGVPVGYTMIAGRGNTLGNIFDGPDAITNAFPDWKRIDVVETIINLLEKYIYLHMHDIVVGDIQLKNAMLYSSKSVYLIDMDSCQVGNLPCPVGTEEFTSPELWGQNFIDFIRMPKHEDYCISMLVFSVLFCGLHPYARRKGKETLREEILDKAFPYTLDNSNIDFIPLGGYQYIWEYLPENIRNMLYDVFKLGKNHEAIEWYSALQEYKENLQKRAFEDIEAYKVFPKMNYKKVVIEDNQNKTNKWQKGSLHDNVVYAGDNNPFAKAAGTNINNNNYSGSFNSNRNQETKKETTPPKPSSAFVPKMGGSAPTNLPEEEEPEKKGLFSKLFGGNK